MFEEQSGFISVKKLFPNLYFASLQGNSYHYKEVMGFT